MATQSIRIPVELELRNIQEAINSLKGGLKGVSKESGFYKTISKELDQVEKKYRELSAVASRPFTNVSSITSFENQFLRLGDRITSIGKAFSELSFKDLDLKGIPNAEEQFKKLTNQVKQAQKALDSVNTNQMKTVLGDSANGLTQAFEKIKQMGHGNLINGESFEKTFSAVSHEIQTVSEKIQQAKQKLEDFKQSGAQTTTRLNLFTEIEKQIQNITSKTDFLNKIKPIASGAGMTSEQLLDLLGLNKPGLFEGAAEKIQKNLEKIIAQNKTNLTDKLVKNKDSANIQQKQIDDLNKYVTALQAAYAELERLQNSPATQLQLAGAQKGVETARQNLDNFIRSCLEMNAASGSAGRALGLVGESASSASPKLRAAENEMRRLGDAARSMDQLKSRMAYFFSFYKVMGTVRKAVNDAVTTIKELDSVMTEIAVVTKMTQQDLWDQVGAYSAIANEYGVTIKGVYEVSQLYYQQGLQTSEVMDLTVETLKMAKIAGLDYATATDYMTVAVRGFKMEMSEAQRVTDVYSALAAGTASDVEELAVAMSKTASSAEAVGSSFESTSAMIATMVSITREAPENIGSALKSIVSRYGEMTSDPAKLVDSEGEVMSLNKVDKALQSVGITLQDVNGQFRDFDDVILELAKSWDTIDKNAQRYIATTFAGNRQQSRFLALVGNYDEYSRALELANGSQDASARQVLKTMDSIETKLTNVKTAWQQFYTSMGLEEVFKGALDVITQIINNINKMSKFEAITSIFNIFQAIKGLVMGIFAGVTSEFSKVQNLGKDFLSMFKQQASMKVDTAQPKQEVESLKQLLINALQQKLNLDVSGAKATLKTLGIDTTGLVAPTGTTFRSIAPLPGYQGIAKQASNLNLETFTAKQFTKLIHEGKGKTITDEFNRVFGKDAKVALDSFKNYLTDFSQKNLGGRGFTSTSLKAEEALKGFIAHLEKAETAAEKQLAKSLKGEIEAKKANGEITTKQSFTQLFQNHTAGLRVAATILQTAGALLTTAALTMKDSSASRFENSKIWSGAGSFVSGIGSAISGALMGAGAGLPGIIIGAIAGGAPAIISGISQIIDGTNKTIEENISILKSELNDLEKEETVKKGEELDLRDSLDEYKKLEEAQYDSAEAAEAFRKHMNSLGEQYPYLIDSMDSMGNAIIQVADLEQALADARYATAQASEAALEKERELLQNQLNKAKKYQDEFEEVSFFGNFQNSQTKLPDFLITKNPSEQDEYRKNAFENWLYFQFDGYNLLDNSTLLDDSGELNHQELQVLYNNYLQKGFDGVRGWLAQLMGIGIDPEIGPLMESSDLDAASTAITNFLKQNLSQTGSFKSFSELAKGSADDVFLYREAIITTLEDLATGQQTNLKDLTGYTSKDLNTFSGKELQDVLQNVIESYQGTVDAAEEALLLGDRLLAMGRFDTKFEGIVKNNPFAKEAEKLTKHQTLFSTLATEMLQAEMEGYSSLGDWYTADAGKYEEEAGKITNRLVTWLKTLSDTTFNDFIEFYNNLDSIKGEDDLRSLLESGDYGEIEPEIIEAIVAQYKEVTDSTKERARSAVQNSKVSSLYKENFKALFNDSELVELSTEYADHVVETINQINDLTERGLVNRAEQLASISSQLYVKLGLLSSEQQGDLSRIINQIDWSDSSSVVSAISAVEEYIKNQDAAGEDITQLKQVLTSLEQARDNLFFNIELSIASYRDAIIGSFEEVEKNYEGLTGGFELKDAVSKFDSLITSDNYKGKNFGDLFHFDKELGKYVYTLEGFQAAMDKTESDLLARRESIESAIAELTNLSGNAESDLSKLVKSGNLDGLDNQTIQNQIKEGVANFVDANFNTTNLTSDQKAALQTVVSEYDADFGSFTDYLTTYVNTLNLSLDEAEQLIIQSKEYQLNHLRSSLDLAGIVSGVHKDNKTQENILTKLGQLNGWSEEYLNALVQSALSGSIKALEMLYGDGEFTYEDNLSIIESQASNFKNAITQALQEPGSTLSEAEGIILSKMGLATDQSGVWKVVEEIQNFQTLIKDIIENERLTLQEQNQLLAEVYTRKDRDSNKYLNTEFLSKDSLTYADLAKLATQKEKDLSEFLKDLATGGIQQSAITGQFEVIDFDAYWELLHGELHKGTAEYLEAYSSWVEDQISKNEQKGKEVTSEIEALIGGKIGEQFKAVFLESVVGDLGKYFKKIENGIITLSAGDDIDGLIQDIANKKIEGAEELGTSITALKDSLNELIQSWADSISAGIEGGLSYPEAEQLKARFDFLSENDFSRTQEGLKLSRDAAIQLYQELKKIDSIEAGTVLESLAESLAAAGEGYEDIGATVARIKELKGLIDNADGKTNSARIAQYERELSLAKEILVVRSENPDSYNFMSKDLGILEGPLNYWNNAGEAFKALNDGASSGFMEVQDYINIITETSNLMSEAGQEFMLNDMNAAQLINAGLGALENIDGEGVKINLSNLGINFVGGVDSLQGNLNSGINDLAQSQIDMIDAAIQLLETIVAMEQISDIDIDSDGIELGELFTFKAGITEETAKGWEDIEDWTDNTKKVLLNLNEGLEDSEGNLTELGQKFNDFKINTHSLYEIINSTPKQLQAMGFSLEQVLNIFQSLQKMIESGDYDLDNLLTSISTILNEAISGSNLILEFGGKTIFVTPEGVKIQINWEEAQINTGGLVTQGTLRGILERANQGGELTEAEKFYYEVIIGNAQVKVKDDETLEFVYNGQTLGAKTPGQAAKEIALIKQSGFENFEGENYQVEAEKGEPITISKEIVIGGVKYIVISTEGEEGVTILDQNGKQTSYTSIDELYKEQAEQIVANSNNEITLAEAYAQLNVKFKIQPNTEAIQKLTPEQLQELSSAYLTDSNKFLQLALQANLIINTNEIKADGSVNQDQINKLAASLGISSVPIPVNITFSGVTATEAASLAGSIKNIADYCNTINGLQFGSFSSFISALQGAFSENSGIETVISNIKKELTELEEKQYTIDLVYNVKTVNADATEDGSYNVTIEDAGATQTLGTLAAALFNVNANSGPATEALNTTMESINSTIDAMGDMAGSIDALTQKAEALAAAASVMPADAAGKVASLSGSMREIPSDAAGHVSTLSSAMNSIPSGTMSLDLEVTVKATGDGSGEKKETIPILSGSGGKLNRLSLDRDDKKQALGFAKGTGEALAGGRKTLMGELGPELYVTGGHYYIAGQNGAEFVDLPSDAIVFNHLQTKKLLSSGSAGTGEPISNERKAVAFATGNASGPAMASASEALSKLKALRAIWQSLLNATSKDISTKAGQMASSGGGGGSGSGDSGEGGGGGGSGGGEGGGDEDQEVVASVLGDLERWYNLLRQIEKIEQQITAEQAKRENLRNGYNYSASLQEELHLLEKQLKANQELAEAQKAFYEQRRKDLQSTDYSMIFTYDEDGLMQYVEQEGFGLDILADLNKTDVNGKALKNATQQLAYLRQIGFDTSVLETNADGTKAEDDEQQMQNFWDGIDGWMEEMDSLYDSYNEAATAVEEATSKMNEILQEYIDNQLEVEQKLFKAIEEREQAEIDRIEDEKRELEEAAQSYIDGLNNALNKERSMYEKNESDAETARLQRRLAILQRSGGSTTEIKSLQDQIDSRLKDTYFQEQQEQIEAIQEASDNQIEKLQTQIDIMNESLEYQKENGLLWNEVYTMMQTWTPEAMLQFIEQYTKEYKENSSLQNQENSQETLKQLEIYAVARDWKNYYDSVTDYSEEFKKQHQSGAYEAYVAAYKTDGEAAAIAAANEYYRQASVAPPPEPLKKREPITGSSSSNKPGVAGSGSTSSGSTSSGVHSSQNPFEEENSAPQETYGRRIQFAQGNNQYYTYDGANWSGRGQIFYGNGQSPVVEVIGETSNMYQISGTDGKGNVFSGRWITKGPWKAFKTGGLVDFTGPAWVDGTKSKPEAFLSASDTAMLKSKIFSNSDGSLKALVAALQTITSNTSRYSRTEDSAGSIIIQNAQVNIQPGTISNDYDARRAGEMALEEMVKIARKTTNRIVSR